MADLTLGDCANQTRGYKGRLFEIKDRLGIGENGEQGNVYVYRVLECDGKTMSIQGYVVGGSFKCLDNIPFDDERKKDIVMDSKLLMEWYRMAGRAGMAGLF